MRRFEWWRRGGVGVVAFWLLCGAACGRQTKFGSERNRSGRFDYYVLALSWAPTFCAHEATNRSAGECGGGHEVGFVVHGLWPESERGRSLENCAPVRPVTPEIVQEMLPLMPDVGLIQHEWRTHGSCSGLAAEEYFAIVNRAAEKIRIPELYQSLQRALTTSPGEVERRFAAVNHLRGVSAVRVQCRAGEVRGVLICLTKDLHPRSCSWNVRDCRAGELFMRPLH
ncbi:MAG: ribonuclease T2 family protein [Bryobacteraceae bacterium]